MPLALATWLMLAPLVTALAVATVFEKISTELMHGIIFFQNMKLKTSRFYFNRNVSFKSI